jgi:hypothetical protein
VTKSSSEDIPNENAQPGVGEGKTLVWPWKSEKSRDEDIVSVNFEDFVLPIKLVIVRFTEYPKSFEIKGYNQFDEPVTICKEEE